MTQDRSKPGYQRVSVTFGIRGDSLQPNQITALLGIRPSHAFAKGDEHISHAGVLKRPWGVWQLRSKENVHSSDLKDHLLYLLGELEQKTHLIRAFIQDPEYYVYVRIWWEGNQAVGSFGIPSDIIIRLGSLCMEWNFSLIARGVKGQAGPKETNGE